MAGLDDVPASGPRSEGSNARSDQPEEERKRPTETAEMRVKRCLEMMHLPWWYREFFKPDIRFLKNRTPFECRPSRWKTMKGKAATATAANAAAAADAATVAAVAADAATVAADAATVTADAADGGKSQQPNGEAAEPVESAQIPRSSLHSGSRVVGRRADRRRTVAERAPVTVTPSSSDNDNECRRHPRRRAPLSGSHTFPRTKLSRKVHNINIVLPRADHATTRNAEVGRAAREQKAVHAQPGTSFAGPRLAEVQPLETLASQNAPSPDARSLDSERKSTEELERSVQSASAPRRGSSFIREIAEVLDRSVTESLASSRPGRPDAELSEPGRRFVRDLVRALERSERERSDDEDSELARSTSISLKSDDEGSGERGDSGGGGSDDDRASSTDDREREDGDTPPTAEPQPAQKPQPAEEEDEVYWIPARVHLMRTSSRLSEASRQPTDAGFQCASGRCSPGLSPIMMVQERARAEGPGPRRRGDSKRRLFRIDETAVVDSGCYSDRSNTTRTPVSCEPSPVPSPGLLLFEGLLKPLRPRMPTGFVRV
ncbi:uncharacterized protein LOC131673134 [Phymastichus coffea]|uniref:uncharacterized protein LOC131673134 n=1 Tax=Phymastichus coffea TaxID=108790 RepID=UPI00273CAB1A|nr:uncharacterized protein LOC131673134 [Phymastichus coffea]